MRPFFVFPVTVFTTLLSLSSAFAQTNPVSGKAFDKMILDFYNFTLLGSSTPATGFKVETVKPSIALKGNILPVGNRGIITSLQLEGGLLDDGAMQIFSNKKVNSYFKGTLGFNFIKGRNSASHYVIQSQETLLTNRAIKRNMDVLQSEIDTFLVLKAMLDDSGFQNNDYDSFLYRVINYTGQKEFLIDNYHPSYLNGTSDSATIKTQKEKHYDSVIQGILLYYDNQAALVYPSYELLHCAGALYSYAALLYYQLQADILDESNTTISLKKLLKDYDRIYDDLLKTGNQLNDKQYDFEIDLTKFNWTTKRVGWLNISLISTNTGFRLLTPDGAGSKIEETHSFLPSLNVSYNWLHKAKAPNKFTYFKVSGFAERASSIDDLDKLTYRKDSIYYSANGETLRKSEDGTAYIGSQVQRWGWGLSFEGYSVPWIDPFAPGFYLKTTYRNNTAWINQHKISLDLGLVWNVNNNEKDSKNLLSVVPYVSWKNLVEEYKTTNKTGPKRTLAELFSVNVKLAIPVNIGK